MESATRDSPESLEELLDRIGEAESDREKVTLDAILDETGGRSFGPMILLAGVIIVAPVIGDIPGVPTVMGLFVLLTGAQLLLGHDHFWLPQWMLKRSMKRERLEKGLDWLRRPARFIDRWLKSRLTVLTRGTGIYVIAAVCVMIALVTPLMEVIPFSANIAGAALTAFGLAMITRDGYLAIAALLLSLGGILLVLFNLL